MEYRQCLMKILLFIYFIDGTAGLWWSLGPNEPFLSHHRICRRMRRLKGPQKSLCRKEPQIIAEVIRGSAIALQHCGLQFESQRWNCSLHKRSLKKILKQDNKEAAILNAFVAAGVTHTVAESCNRGKFRQCSCLSLNNEILENQKYTTKSGHLRASRKLGRTVNYDDYSSSERCINALRFGVRISRRMDHTRRHKTRTNSDVRTVVRLHNSELGRKMIINNMRNSCKCHGLSGSCSLKICSLTLPSMDIIAKILFKKYFQAIKVTSANDGKQITATESWKRLKKDDLAYLEESPNFCLRNVRLGSLGTIGRECNTSASSSMKRCELLCCGRGYSTHIEQMDINCNCKFRFCCKVECEKCQVLETKTFCQ